AHFGGLRQHAMTAEARTQQKIVIGPWAHRFPYTSPTSQGTGDIDFGPKACIALHETQLRWFDYYLKGINTGILEEAPVKIFVMGENVWQRRAGMAAGAHALYTILPAQSGTGQ